MYYCGLGNLNGNTDRKNVWMRIANKNWNDFNSNYPKEYHEEAKAARRKVIFIHRYGFVHSVWGILLDEISSVNETEACLNSLFVCIHCPDWLFEYIRYGKDVSNCVTWLPSRLTTHATIYSTGRCYRIGRRSAYRDYPWRFGIMWDWVVSLAQFEAIKRPSNEIPSSIFQLYSFDSFY